MQSLSTYLRKHWVWLLANVGGLIPFALLIWGFAGGRWVDPVAEITSRTGSAALIMLIASLAVTPINSVIGWRQIIPARKPLGLYAFGYASLHLLNFIGLDYGFSLQAFLSDALLQKRFMIVGFSAFLILLPLDETVGAQLEAATPTGLCRRCPGGIALLLVGQDRHYAAGDLRGDFGPVAHLAYPPASPVLYRATHEAGNHYRTQIYRTTRTGC